jgi:hypothetical protein
MPAKYSTRGYLRSAGLMVNQKAGILRAINKAQR